MERTAIHWNPQEGWHVDVLPDDSMLCFVVLAPRPESKEAQEFLRELDKALGIESAASIEIPPLNT